MDGRKRIDMMLEELREDLDAHTAKSKNSFYFALDRSDSGFAVDVDLYFGGGALEADVLSLPDCSQPLPVNCALAVDGEEIYGEEGAIAIRSFSLEEGCHTFGASVSSNAVGARLRLSGNIIRCDKKIS